MHTHTNPTHPWHATLAYYSRTCLFRHHLIRQFVQFITYLLVPAEFLSFVYVSVHLICQFA